MFGIIKKKIVPTPAFDHKTVFYKDAIYHPQQGRVVVSNAHLGLKNESVAFAFLGTLNQPDVTPALLDYLAQQAEEQGYTFHYLQYYGLNAAQEVVNLLPYPEDEAA